MPLILLDNGYPLHMIFSIIKRRLFYRLRHNLGNHNTSDPISLSYFIIPFVSFIANKFVKYFKNISFIKLAFACYNKLNKFIKIHKDALPFYTRPNVVYKINCLDCVASYVGQTKRSLGIRVGEHRNHIRRSSTQPSVITDHRLSCNHKFDSVKVLDKERNNKKRLISESYIKKQKLGLNSQNNTVRSGLQ